MAARLLDAKHKADRGDNEALRAFVNTALAKTWREEAETANPEPLLAGRENYSADALPYRILYLTEALDRRVYALAALHARPVPCEVLLRAAPIEPPPRPPSPPEGGGSPPPPPASPLPAPASRFERRRIRFRMR
jgi:phage terminase large subunit GpA-like protein